MPLEAPRQAADSYSLYTRASDLSAALSHWIPVPEAGFIEKVIVTRNATFDAPVVLTLATPNGTVGQTLTLPTGGAAGDVDVFDVSKGAANNHVEANQAINIESDGGGTTAGAAEITVVMGVY